MLGAAGYEGTTWTEDWISTGITAAHAALVASLDTARVAELIALGARFTPAETVAYLKTEADRVLDA
jgi:hypothetical protein